MKIRYEFVVNTMCAWFKKKTHENLPSSERYA